MAISLFERVTAALFGGPAASPDDAAERQLIDDTIELVVETVEPRVRLNPRYRQKLEGCVRTSIAYLRSIGREGFEPILLARAAWNEDPRLNAFFATADDVPACLGRSRELRAFFANPSNGDVQEAFALLGMKKEERTVFGHAAAGRCGDAGCRTDRRELLGASPDCAGCHACRYPPGDRKAHSPAPRAGRVVPHRRAGHEGDRVAGAQGLSRRAHAAAQPRPRRDGRHRQRPRDHRIGDQCRPEGTERNGRRLRGSEGEPGDAGRLHQAHRARSSPIPSST